MLPARPRIRSEAKGDEYPVSRFQERQVLLERQERKEGRPRADNLYLAYRVSGHLDEQIMRRSLDVITRRHEPLRTVFPPEGHEPPLARVLAQSATQLVVGSSLPAEGKVEAVEEAALRSCLATPFDIQSGPVFRASLVPIGRDQQLLMLCLDHIVADGVGSLNILGRELAAVYCALASGGEPALPPLPFEYSDFAVTHRSWLTEGVRSEILGHWKARLPPRVPEPPLDLPPLLPGSERALGRTGVVERAVPGGLFLRLPELRARFRATTFVVFYTALLAALRVHSDHETVGAMFPIDFRSGYRAQPLIGRFSNLSVLWMPVARTRRLDELLLEVRTRTHSAMQHADLPFGEIVRELYPDWYGNIDTPPYVFFGVQSASPQAWRTADLTAQPVQIAPALRSQLHPGVKVQVHAGPQAVSLSCQYSVEAYHHDAVAGLLDAMVRSVELLAERPEASVADLAALLSA